MKKDVVLCLVQKIVKPLDEQTIWMDLEDWGLKNPSTYEEIVIPLYNHPHTDKENGQFEVHYHRDFRYQAENLDNYYGNSRVSLPLEENQKLEFRELSKISDVHTGITPTFFIKKSKLKHKCIHKGKCPHRGFDLTNVTPILEGIGREAREVITCPLHGLKFDKATKKLINNEEI
jgi:hypothetical protein